jgi:hypothetical protein
MSCGGRAASSAKAAARHLPQIRQGRQINGASRAELFAWSGEPHDLGLHFQGGVHDRDVRASVGAVSATVRGRLCGRLLAVGGPGLHGVVARTAAARMREARSLPARRIRLNVDGATGDPIRAAPGRGFIGRGHWTWTSCRLSTPDASGWGTSDDVETFGPGAVATTASR